MEIEPNLNRTWILFLVKSNSTERSHFCLTEAKPDRSERLTKSTQIWTVHSGFDSYGHP